MAVHEKKQKHEFDYRIMNAMATVLLLGCVTFEFEILPDTVATLTLTMLNKLRCHAQF